MREDEVSKTSTTKAAKAIPLESIYSGPSSFGCAYLLARSLALCFLLGQTLNAYEVPLNSDSVHEAYVLGQRNDKATADFVASYTRQVTVMGLDGPHRADIQILTPYLQVVDHSTENASGYSERQAREDYRRSGDIVVVRVVLLLPGAYPREPSGSGPATVPCENTVLRPENFWQNFRFILKQNEKIPTARSIRQKPIYSAGTKDAAAVLDGATILLEFDAKDVASKETTIEIVTPDCKTISATFNLQKLR
jgi:hypothetical protein